MLSHKPFKLDRIAFYGRSIKEYEKMFLIDFSTFQGKRVLDCPSGPSSFCKEARDMGIDVLAIDPLFKFDINHLSWLAVEDMEHVLSRIYETRLQRKWDYYHNLEDLKETQLSTLKVFLKDYSMHHSDDSRYLAGSLPKLPFQNAYFDLALSGHFLFSYASYLNVDFTIDALLELSRIAKEVRVFPLRSNEQNREKIFHSLNDILTALDLNQIQYEIQNSDFEFQSGANQTLIMRRF